MITRRSPLSNSAALTLAVLMGTALPCATLAHADDMAAMISTAKTKADHEKIAADYDKEAADARAKAELHRNMAETYRKAGPSIGKGLSGGNTALVKHCDDLAKSYGAAADQAAALAKAHREMAAATN